MRLTTYLSALALLIVGLVPPRAHAAEGGFTATFELEVLAATERSKSVGTLEFKDALALFMDVTEPTRQQVFYLNGRITLVYPEQKIVMEGKYPPAGSPLAFDTLSFATTRLGDTTTDRARLVETTTSDAGKLRQRWEVVDLKGKAAGEIHVEEGPGGVEMVAIVDTDGVVRRRYRMGTRVPVGEAAIPQQIDGEYFDVHGQPLRAERWTFTDIAPLPPEGTRRAGKEAVRPPDAEVRELNW